MQQPNPPQAFPFTPDQYQRLLALIGCPGIGFQAQGRNAAPKTTQPAMATMFQSLLQLRVNLAT